MNRSTICRPRFTVFPQLAVVCVLSAVLCGITAGEAPAAASTLDVYLYKQFTDEYGPDPLGEIIPIGVHVYNPGPDAETGIRLELYNLTEAEDVLIGTATIDSLCPECGSTVYVDWDTDTTKGWTKGNYTLQATAAVDAREFWSDPEVYYLAPRLVVDELATSKTVYPPKASIFVHMHVTDAGGSDVEGAYSRVNIWPPGNWRVWCTGWTGPDGKFGVLFDHQMKFGTGTFRVEAYAWSPDYARGDAQTWYFDVVKEAEEGPTGTGTIKGTVTYPDGSPGKRATVGALRLSDLYMTENTYTNGKGRYTLENVPPGEYLVLAYIWNTSWDGEIVVTVEEAEVVTADIELQGHD